MYLISNLLWMKDIFVSLQYMLHVSYISHSFLIFNSNNYKNKYKKNECFFFSGRDLTWNNQGICSASSKQRAQLWTLRLMTIQSHLTRVTAEGCWLLHLDWNLWICEMPLTVEQQEQTCSRLSSQTHRRPVSSRQVKGQTNTVTVGMPLGLWRAGEACWSRMLLPPLLIGKVARRRTAHEGNRFPAPMRVGAWKEGEFF